MQELRRSTCYRYRIVAEKLTQLVRGQLDWIVMRALEKDRSRRYAAASDLARDIQRHLNDEPVEACPPSRGYRLAKYARKNRRLDPGLTKGRERDVALPPSSADLLKSREHWDWEPTCHF